MKKIIIIVILILVALGVSYMATNWPLTSNENTQGTLGGVQKVEKFRSKQLTEKNLTIDSPEITKFTQSAEWQNAMKDEKFVKMLASKDFQKVMKLMNISNNLLRASQKLNLVFTNNDFSKMNNEQFKALLGNNFEAFFSTDFQNDQQKMSKFRIAAVDFQKMMPMNNDIEKLNSIFVFFLGNTELGNSVLRNTDFSKALGLKPDVNGMFNANDFTAAFLRNQDMEKIWAQDMKNVAFACGFDFNKMRLSSDFNKGLVDVPAFDFNNENLINLVNNVTFKSITFNWLENDFHNFVKDQAEMHGIVVAF